MIDHETTTGTRQASSQHEHDRETEDREPTLEQQIATWRSLDREYNQLLDRREQAAAPIESAAHGILRERGSYTRAGQYPELRGTGTDSRLVFRISNGIDYDDDFTACLTDEELLGDPLAERARRLRGKARAAKQAARDARRTAEHHEANARKLELEAKRPPDQEEEP